MAAAARRAAGIALAATVVLGLGTLSPLDPLAVHGPLPGHAASLRYPPGYLLVAPIARTLDELSLLEKNQHIAVLGTLVGLAVLIGVRRAARPGGTLVARVARFLLGAGTTLTIVVAFYSFGALAPRPMVALSLSGDSLLTVDFHSHTAASHDGRWDFSAEDNRAWHTGAGFDAAYVTDHQTMRAWRELAERGALGPAAGAASSRSPSHGGGATVLLPGAETHAPGVHVNLLGIRPEHAGIFLKGREVDVAGMDRVTSGPDAPLLLVTLPYDTARIAGHAHRIGAIELSDASPRGLEFGRHQRPRHLALAESLRVPLVAASNNHGWGRTAAAWTVLSRPGWQQLEPFALDRAIRERLRTAPATVSVVERRGLAASDALTPTVLTAPRLVAHLARSLPPLERLSWFAWTWAVAFALLALRSRRASGGQLPRPATIP